jgi:ATP-dependent Clp protease adaptor protein ClpS
MEQDGRGRLAGNDDLECSVWRPRWLCWERLAWLLSDVSAAISNARAMSQIVVRIDFPIAAALATSMPRMGNDENRPGTPSGPTTSVITKVKPKTKRPNLYRVLILNDDYTPMEFVVLVLEKFFQKDVEAATKIMLHVHHHGIGECGVFTYEIAETKVTQVMDFARKHQHPLQCVMEKK